jgi:hypothetical protein
LYRCPEPKYTDVGPNASLPLRVRTSFTAVEQCTPSPPLVGASTMTPALGSATNPSAPTPLPPPSLSAPPPLPLSSPSAVSGSPSPPVPPAAMEKAPAPKTGSAPAFRAISGAAATSNGRRIAQTDAGAGTSASGGSALARCPISGWTARWRRRPLGGARIPEGGSRAGLQIPEGGPHSLAGSRRARFEYRKGGWSAPDPYTAGQV